MNDSTLRMGRFSYIKRLVSIFLTMSFLIFVFPGFSLPHDPVLFYDWVLGVWISSPPLRQAIMVIMGFMSLWMMVSVVRRGIDAGVYLFVVLILIVVISGQFFISDMTNIASRFLIVAVGMIAIGILPSKEIRAARDVDNERKRFGVVVKERRSLVDENNKTTDNEGDGAVSGGKKRGLKTFLKKSPSQEFSYPRYEPVVDDSRSGIFIPEEPEKKSRFSRDHSPSGPSKK